MPTAPLSFEQRLADDKAWFAKNPTRSFRVQVVSNVEIQHFLATRDLDISPVAGLYTSSGSLLQLGVMISFWRYTPNMGETLDHLIVRQAPQGFIDAVNNDDSDALPYNLFFVWDVPVIQDAAWPWNIVIRSPADGTLIKTAA